jgi:hypothetical protein
MIGTHDDGLETSKTALPAAVGGSINGMRVLMGLLLLLIAVAAISGIVVALSSGQPTVAFIIGLVAVAFFSRIGC